MEARMIRATLVVATLLVSMGARYRTKNFVVDAPHPTFAKQVGDAAERYRHDLAIEWTGKAMPNWSQPCVLTVQVGPRMGNGGATTFVFDRGEVFGWRMSIQGTHARLLDSVLPHEITHTILASHFRKPVPRWADEGAATSIEHYSERNKYNRMLYEFLQSGRGIAFNRMFAMKQYPPDMMPLYAQGHSLATYLIQVGGRQKFVAFVGQGMDTNNWPQALTNHYGFADAAGLQRQWLAWVQQGSPKLQRQPQHPAAPRSDQMLAAAPSRSSSTAPTTNTTTPRPSVYQLAAANPPSPSRPAASRSPTATPTATPKAAAASAASELQHLPDSGWRAAGDRSAEPVVAAVAEVSQARDQAVVPAAAVAPIQAARPQPIQQPRQTILEWNARH